MSNGNGVEEEVDLTIQRALEAAQLRAGDALGGTSAVILEDCEPSAVEAGDADGSGDGD
ncbi:hypothetical protein [Agromyces archimandritae]|uniref:Uncharacterized protein n=1 Tax=Agromyces archimandritae TaxID=2781962 RepID=A0A975FMD2_9MICO|nr:hypothetical protein [Agromyces archimandritae]QTX04779.1 hypothetical protein G127AT_00430 [Agromyces archimandritae]